MDNLKFFTKNFDAKGKGLSGIVNNGNTCFMNSTLQCLSQCLPLTRFFITGDFLEDANPNREEFELCKEYIRILLGLWEDNCIISPISFKRTLGKFHNAYTGFRQHDSHELMVRLIDVLHVACSYKADISYTGDPHSEYDNMKVRAIEVWGDHFKKQYSRVIDLFYGQFNSSMMCNLCDHIYHAYDPFCSISLPINTDTKNIYQCLDLFTSKEVLDENNKWKCDKCCKLTQATKKIVIWKAPTILIVSFKRFDHLNRKSNQFIDYPVQGLNINKYVFNSTDSIYDLFGISVHTGHAESGHYYSYCQNADGNWYKFDDQDVTKIDEKNLVTPHAYVLLYQRRDTRP